ncbi:MAG: winged helix-turn-helix domain-containing protein, partial [Oscillochloris sp.]|nr:winged helix-turn-helix domain-containing protein [Oscillochloris sp.]
MLSPGEWLSRVGFVEGNPFALKWADDERDRLHEYFVAHSAYFEVLDSDLPRSSIIHAPRGSGKSSTRHMFEAAQQRRIGARPALILRLIDWMPIIDQAGAARAVGIAHLLRELLRLFMVALTDELIHGASVASLVADDANYLSWISRHFDDYLSPAQRRTLVEQGWCERSLANADAYDITRLPPLRSFEILTRLSSALGFAVCYVVIDGVDEIFTTVADWEAGAALLAPLLGNVRLLEIPGLAFKCFVPSEIIAVLRAQKILREDRVSCIELTWSTDLLLELLRTRLGVFSDGAIRSLSMIADPDLGDLDTGLCHAAAGSPRRLLFLGDRLIRACAYDSDDTSLLIRRQHLAAVGANLPDQAPPDSRGNAVVPPLSLRPDGSVWHGEAPVVRARRLSVFQRRLLQYLYEHAGRICSTAELIDYVWHDRNRPNDTDSLRKLADRLSEIIEPDVAHPGSLI